MSTADEVRIASVHYDAIIEKHRTMLDEFLMQTTMEAVAYALHGIKVTTRDPSIIDIEATVILSEPLKQLKENNE